jgi:hypothetical protein
VPQIINKSLATQILDRFVVDPDGPAYDEWSIYFNVAADLYPAHFRFAPYVTLGWPMRMGDWFPQVTPQQPLFENYYPQNYAPVGMFAGLAPLGNVEPKMRRYGMALARAQRAERDGQDGVRPRQLVLMVGPAGLSFVAGGPVLAGKENVRRILLINGTRNGWGTLRGKLDMFLADASGAVFSGEGISLGEVCWLPPLPPERPGLYQLRFFATLDTGARLEARATLEVVADEAGV